MIYSFACPVIRGAIVLRQCILVAFLARGWREIHSYLIAWEEARILTSARCRMLYGGKVILHFTALVESLPLGGLMGCNSFCRIRSDLTCKALVLIICRIQIHRLWCDRLAQVFWLTAAHDANLFTFFVVSVQDQTAPVDCIEGSWLGKLSFDQFDSLRLDRH